jgi:hypothetical protein
MKELKELEGVIEAKGGISAACLDRVHLLTDTYKNICKIEKYDSDSEEEVVSVHKKHHYSSGEVKELMEKLYDDTEHSGDKAAILKIIRDI